MASYIRQFNSVTLLQGPQFSCGGNPFLKVRSNKMWCSPAAYITWLPYRQTVAAEQKCAIRQGSHHFRAPDLPPSWRSQHINTFEIRDVNVSGVERLWQLGVCKCTAVRPYSVQYVDCQHCYTCSWLHYIRYKTHRLSTVNCLCDKFVFGTKAPRGPGPPDSRSF
jgi:hypothetical protein